VQRLETKMERGDMDEMSFAFRVKADKWSDDDTERTLTEVSLHKGDVSVVNFGANPATSAQLNSMQEALEFLAGVDPEQARSELRSGGQQVLQHLAQAREMVLALHRSTAKPKSGRLLSVADARAMEDSDSALPLAPSIPSHGTAVVEGAMDRRAAVDEAPNDQVVLRYMHAWVDAEGDPEDKRSYRFAHHEGRVGSPANLGAVRYALSRLPHSDIPDDQRAAVEAHLRRHLADAD
jgi:hypothetical protein